MSSFKKMHILIKIFFLLNGIGKMHIPIKNIFLLNGIRWGDPTYYSLKFEFGYKKGPRNTKAKRRVRN